MRSDGNGGSGPNWPNCFDSPTPDPNTADPGMAVSAMTGRTEYPNPNDQFARPRALFRDVMTAEDRDHLVSNIFGHLGKARERIRLRQCAVFYKVDAEYGRRVVEGVGVDVAEVERLAGIPAQGLVMAGVRKTAATGR